MHRTKALKNVVFSLVFLILPAHRTSLSDNKTATDSATKPNKDRKPIHLGITLIWEGDHIHRHNIKAIRKLREKFQGLNFFHLLSPKYFLDLQQDEIRRNRAKIRSVVTVGDHIGLYLQPRRSITKQAGVIFKPGPTFWGHTIKDCSPDCGKEVPLSIYTETEINRLIMVSKNIIQSQGFGTPRLFMAGGWLAPKNVMNAVVAQRFLYSFSAISPNLVKRRLQNFPLYQWIKHRWGHITPLSQPRMIHTANAPITEINFSGGVADFLTPRETLGIFEKYTNLHAENPYQTLVFNIGFHQETADQFIHRMTTVITTIFEFSQKNGIVVRPLVLPGPSIAVRR